MPSVPSPSRFPPHLFSPIGSYATPPCSLVRLSSMPVTEPPLLLAAFGMSPLPCPPTVRACSRTIYSKSRRRLTLPFSSKLQGHTFITAGHQSSPTAVERRCPKPLAPPRCWPTSLVCFCPLLLARPYLGVPLVLTGSTLPSASRYQATGESVTMLPCACHVAGRGPFSPLDRAARPRPTRIFGRPHMAENGLRPNTVHEFSNLF
jgi:hypothetical protein